jgi:hypothetical protein
MLEHGMGEDKAIAAASGSDLRPQVQRAAARVQFGERFSAGGEVQVTPAGLLAIGGMVAAVLIGTALVVRAARR